MAKSAHERRDAVSDARGSLLIIGGHETKEGHRPILEELARRTEKGKLVVRIIHAPRQPAMIAPHCAPTA